MATKKKTKKETTASASSTAEEDRLSSVEADGTTVELGEIVTYFDEISGEARDARLSNVFEGTSVGLAVFLRGGGAVPKAGPEGAGVPLGTGPGCWQPKESA